MDRFKRRAFCVFHLAMGLSMLASPTVLAEPPSADEQENEAHLVERDDTIAINVGPRSILVYNKRSPPVPDGIDPLYHRSGFIHPVFSPSGQIVTATFPRDHPHQHGIFAAWVKTAYEGKDVDFWNLAGGTGRVIHHRVVSTQGDGGRVGFEIELRHRIEGESPQDVLRENWKVTLVDHNERLNCFDIESTQVALTTVPLQIQEYHYGGMALRGPVAWLNETSKQASENENCRMLNDLGNDRTAGNHAHAKWVAMTGSLGGQAVCIAVLSHRENFRSPQAARLHPTKPYFVYSPCVDGEFAITEKHSLHNRYRYIVTDTAPDLDWLNQQWTSWCGLNDR